MVQLAISYFHCDILAIQKPDIFYTRNQAASRAWLKEHHLAKQSVWVVFYAQSSPKPSASWSEA